MQLTRMRMAPAMIVEEAVIKIIHSEGCRRVLERGGKVTGNARAKLFAEDGDISFGLLKLVNSQVRGLEVEKNRYWEWEEAIKQGYETFNELETFGAGTVHVDMCARRLSFMPPIDQISTK